MLVFHYCRYYMIEEVKKALKLMLADISETNLLKA